MSPELVSSGASYFGHEPLRHLRRDVGDLNAGSCVESIGRDAVINEWSTVDPVVDGDCEVLDAVKLRTSVRETSRQTQKSPPAMRSQFKADARSCASFTRGLHRR
jgi:hypothetical protein